MPQRITKAVIPAAGFGTRMLPFTKAVPKELIPLVDKPVIQYVLEEAVNSGITDILLILSEGKEAVLNHFRPHPALEARLKESGKIELLKSITPFSSDIKISCVWQEELDGLGGAVKLAEDFVDGEFFAVLLGDTVLDSTSDIPVTRQLIEAYELTGNSVVAVEKMAKELLGSYGCIGGIPVAESVLLVDAMVEKPLPHEVPGEFAVASRYLLSPEIFTLLKSTPRGKANEIQLTDAIKQLIPANRLNARIISGHRHDLGSKAGFLAANIAFALRDPKLAGAINQKLAALSPEIAAKFVK